MTAFTEKNRPGECLMSEANGSRSRDEVTLTASQGALEPNTVLAKVTSTGNWVILAPGGSGGAQTAAGILFNAAPNSAATQKVTIIARDAEVLASRLTYPAGISGPQTVTANANLALQNIIVRGA